MLRLYLRRSALTTTHVEKACPAVVSAFAFAANGQSSSLLRTTSIRLEKSKKFKHLNPITPDNAVNPLSKPLELDRAALHVVSSPIGNVKDFSIRSLEVLRQCDYIVCTNRNATKALMNIIDIDFAGRLIQLQSTSPAARAQQAQQLRNAGVNSSSSNNPSSDNSGVGIQRIVDMLRGGRSMALVTPSGTPCIGDGGSELVQQCIANDVRVVSVPGPSAVVSALSICGAPMMTNQALLATANGGSVGATAFGEGSFFFGGQLSEKAGIRARQLRQVRDFSCPVVFYDVPSRVVASLTDMAAILDRRVGDAIHSHSEESETSSRNRSFRRPRRITILHEVTKFNESSHAGNTTALLRYYSQMGRSTQLTELGQLMVVIDGVATSDLVKEEQQLAENSSDARRSTKRQMCSGEEATREDSYFRSSVFGGKNSQAPETVDENRISDEASKSQPQLVPPPGPVSRKQRLIALRRKLRRELRARRARVAAKAMVERESLRRLYEGSGEPTPLP